jgi:hypothetical protein
MIEARYEEGLLKPEKPLALAPGERVALIVLRHPDPRRWDPSIFPSGETAKSQSGRRAAPS